MRTFPIATVVFMILFFEGCIPAAQVKGRYTNVFAGVTGEELRFSQEPKKFEYYFRTEGALKSYSSGTWKQDKKVIFLNGFDDKNINALNIESNVEYLPNENRDKIVIQYKDEVLDTFTKVDVIVNGNPRVRIQGDTTYFTDEAVRKLQIKSYLVHEGLLLGTSTTIDTLYSPEMEVAISTKHKKILLKLSISRNHFIE